MVALGLRSIDDDVNIISTVDMRCMAQAVVDWHGHVLRITQGLRLSESALETRRWTTDTNGIFVQRADEDLGKRHAVLEEGQQG